MSYAIGDNNNKKKSVRVETTRDILYDLGSVKNQKCFRLLFSPTVIHKARGVRLGIPLGS